MLMGFGRLLIYFVYFVSFGLEGMIMNIVIDF
jgi:hypothetical protein